MREAAENRVTGVTENKRRRHYGHAAELVAACLTFDPIPDTLECTRCGPSTPIRRA